MRRALYAAFLILAAPLQGALAVERQECPMLLQSTARTPSGENGKAFGSDGAYWTVLRGRLLWRSNDGVEHPIRDAVFYRGCFDASNREVLRELQSVSVGEDGRFAETIFIPQASESYPEGDIQISNEWAEKWFFAVTAPGCTEKVMDYDRRWQDQLVELVCPGRSK
jgi:hypothetical protein